MKQNLLSNLNQELTNNMDKVVNTKTSFNTQRSTVQSPYMTMRQNTINEFENNDLG